MGMLPRPPLALAASRDTPSQLGPQGFERESLGEHVVGAAVDGADIVVVAQVNRKRRRNDFLTARRIIWRHQPARLHLLDRSEEHTSELPSLMRISYAVFCLKKK